MKAIQVKYLPATDLKVTRVKAFADKGISVTLPLDYEISNYLDQAEIVARELIHKYEWNVTITGRGVLPNGEYVFTIK